MTRAERRRLQRELKILRAALAGIKPGAAPHVTSYAEWARRHVERLEMLLNGAGRGAA